MNGSALPSTDLEAEDDGNKYCARLCHPQHEKQTECRD
jgi:hypothetical protein